MNSLRFLLYLRVSIDTDLKYSYIKRMKWFFYGLIVLFVGAVSYQFLVDKKGGLQVTPSAILTGKMRAPGFDGGTKWVNSDPLVLSELVEQKKVVLVDFWTYSCINCQRTLPYLKQWWSKYKDKGLVIVGVHAPEFEFEKKTENVESAMEKYGVTWPVVQDNEMKIWRLYANRYWPAKYLVTPPNGEIVYTHFGEGEYEETEMVIRGELEKLGYDLSGMSVEEENEILVRGGISPETYLGYDRGRFGNGEQIVADSLKEYEIKGGVMGDLAYLGGEWKVGEEFSVSGESSVIVYKFTGGEVNLVMNSESKKKVKVFVDDELVKTVEVEFADLYNLYKGEKKTAVMRLEFDQGIEAYAFTFGQ